MVDWNLHVWTKLIIVEIKYCQWNQQTVEHTEYNYSLKATPDGLQLISLQIICVRGYHKMGLVLLNVHSKDIKGFPFEILSLFFCFTTYLQWGIFKTFHSTCSAACGTTSSETQPGWSISWEKTQNCPSQDWLQLGFQGWLSDYQLSHKYKHCIIGESQWRK